MLIAVKLLLAIIVCGCVLVITVDTGCVCAYIIG